MTFACQDGFDIRCEWGQAGLAALEGCRTFLVVDVLSFSTCVSIAATRGTAIAPCRCDAREATALAQRLGALVAGSRGAGASLSPESLLSAAMKTRMVLPSPNGATLSVEAASRGHVLAGCLRNRSAVARRAASLGGPFGVLMAGERWGDGSLRPCLEDLLGAGAIVAALSGSCSPEASSAAAAFAAASSNLEGTLLSCASGRELIARGFHEDVRLAAALDVDAVAPALDSSGCFVHAPANAR